MCTCLCVSFRVCCCVCNCAFTLHEDMRALLTAWALPSAVVVAGVVGVPGKVVYAVCSLLCVLQEIWSAQCCSTCCFAGVEVQQPRQEVGGLAGPLRVGTAACNACCVSQLPASTIDACCCCCSRCVDDFSSCHIPSNNSKCCDRQCLQVCC